MGEPTAKKPFLFVVGPLPPPMHGQAATTKAFVDRIAPHVRLKIGDVSPGARAGRLARLIKAHRIVSAAFGLAACVPTERNRLLYMAADGGYGILFNIAVAGAARIFGYRIFLHHHSFAYIDNRSPLMAALARVMGRKGTHIVLCQAMEEGLRARYPALATSPMIELTSAAFIEVPEAPPPILDANLRIGFLSNLIVEKGLDTCIDLLRVCRREGLPVRLLLAGRSPGRRSTEIVEAAIAEFGPAIRYLGPLSEKQKTLFFADIDVFAFPTRYANEAQPRVVLESLYFGVPVLTNARGCIASDLDERCGLCVPPGGDFVARALPLLRKWCADRPALAQSVREARERAEHLRETGRRQLNSFVAMLEGGEQP